MISCQSRHVSRFIFILKVVVYTLKHIFEHTKYDYDIMMYILVATWSAVFFLAQHDMRGHILCTKGVACGEYRACAHARTVTGKRITVSCADTKDTLFARTDARKAS